MKKTAAILLICLLAFNWYGYRIVTDLLSNKADQQLEAQLDNNQYDESQLIEVKVALNVPYQNNSSEFERHYGEVEANGIVYTYVESKVENGYLVMRCIPNESKTKIRSAGNDYYKMTNGLDQDHQGKKSDNTQVVKQSIGDFDDQLETFAINAFEGLNPKNFVQQSCLLYSTAGLTPAQPPESLA